jgi:Na+/H+-dicarboxylate symporter
VRISTENLTLLAIVGGVLFGHYLPEVALDLKVIGTIFLSLLKMLIVPLIFASIFVAIAGLGDAKSLRDLGGKAVLYYLLTTTLAVFTGLVAINVSGLGVGAEYSVPSGEVPTITEFSIEKFFLGFIPTNIVESLANGSIIQIIVFTMLLAMASLHLDQSRRDTIYSFFDSLNETMMVVAMWVIKLTPIGVFSLIGYVIAEKGLDSLLNLWQYVLVVVMALGFHSLVTLPSLLYLFRRISPLKYFLQIREAPLLAFSTASSSATLPVSIEVAEKKGGVSKRSAGFILPLGATMNMDGTALYQSIAVMFMANLTGVDLSIGQQLLIFVTTVMASVGAAGIPGAGLIMMIVVLDTVGIPHTYIPLILVVDRILDMFRTATNVWGDLIGAKVLDRG